MLLVSGEREAGVNILAFPGATNPAVVGVVADEPVTDGAGASHDVEVVEVVTGSGHGRAMPAVGDENDITGAYLFTDVDGAVVRGIDPLVADGVCCFCRGTGGGAGFEVVDFFEGGFPVLFFIVLVGRVRRPVAGGGDNFTDDDAVSFESCRCAPAPRNSTGISSLVMWRTGYSCCAGPEAMATRTPGSAVRVTSALTPV